MGPNQDLKDNTVLFTPGMRETIIQEEVGRKLGVLVDQEANWRAQRIKAASNTKQMGGWVLRTFTERDTQLLRTLWRNSIQPHQDFCSQLWLPVGLDGDLTQQEAPLHLYNKWAWDLLSVPLGQVPGNGAVFNRMQKREI